MMLRKNVYTNVTTAIKYSKTELSNHVPINKWVTRGYILSPLLFNIFINEIIPLFHEADSQQTSLVHKTMGCLLYADDLVILSIFVSGLQIRLDNINSYCNKWKFGVNLTKSKVTCFNVF